MLSSVAKGNLFEKQIYEELQRMNIKSKIVGRKGDNGVDLEGQIVGRPFIIQAKNWTTVKIDKLTTY